jgi:hypothetical protein
MKQTMWQGWKKTSIGNKIGAICGVLSLLVSLGSAIFNRSQVTIAREQYQLAARANHEQRLLEWTRLKFEDDSEMPNIDPVTVPSNDANSLNQTVVRLLNFGSGPTDEIIVQDTVTGKLIIQLGAKISPQNGPLNFTIPRNTLERSHLMKSVVVSPHGSTRTKTFYFLADNQFKPIAI